MRTPVLVISVLAVAAPALAADIAPAGRYKVAPSADGFVRLDTTTGALTHCTRRDGVWFCDPLAENRSDQDKRIAELGAKVAAVTIQLARLAATVATLDQRVKTVESAPPPVPETHVAEPPKPDVSVSPPVAETQVTPPSHPARKGLSGEVVRRFIVMVREMKRGSPAGS